MTVYLGYLLKQEASQYNTNMTKTPFILKVDDWIELRLQTLDDADEQWQLLTKTIDYLSKWVDWAQPTYTEADMRRDIAANVAKYEAGNMYAMGVYFDKKLVGNVDVRDITDGGSAEVGYFLEESYTGRGIATKSAQALMDYVQTKHNVRRFYLSMYTENDASKKVAKRLEFQLVSENTTDNGRSESRYQKDVSPRHI